MVAYAELFEPEVSNDPSPFEAAVAVAVGDDGEVADELLLVSMVCSGKQGEATFTGYVADNETGLLHARARQYSPTLGRFVGRDPAGYVNGTGLYGAYFVPNRLDPKGLWTTGDFINHYFFEGGSPLDLNKLPAFFKKWRDHIAPGMINKLKKQAASRLSCACDSGSYSFNTTIFVQVHPDGNDGGLIGDRREDSLFSMGASSLQAEVSCTYDSECVDCPCDTKAPVKMNATCTAKMKLRDRFDNPFDVNGATYDDKQYKEGYKRCMQACSSMKYPGRKTCESKCRQDWPDPNKWGTPYEINADWSESFTVSKDCDGCPSSSK